MLIFFIKKPAPADKKW